MYSEVKADVKKISLACSIVEQVFRHCLLKLFDSIVQEKLKLPLLLFIIFVNQTSVPWFQLNKIVLDKININDIKTARRFLQS